ncbi:hypothetical protein ONE63_007643 [Megalurothrips usitatus]|uniref:Uncharacterized protein n=1 Tax=Megalurothrips usitatus TaxID=439358 RepID=A0AAV7XPE0_9NEOP|nr:hypothetical protein ONE63_007643 [Megalurothrips usitatus]
MVHSRAVQAAGYLLQTFDRNSVFTNHCVAKLLHRIVWEAKMPGMLYQASLFRSFQRVLKSPLPQHKVEYSAVLTPPPPPPPECLL